MCSGVDVIRLALSHSGRRFRVGNVRLYGAAWLMVLVSAPAAAQGTSPPQALWASLGAGGSQNGIAVLASASYARGLALISARADAIGGWTGPAIDDKAILVGARSGAGSSFTQVAVGIGHARYTIKHSDTAPTRYPGQTVLAFDAKAQGGFEAVPVGIGVIGVLGRGDTRYVALVLTLELGTFGGQ